MMMNRVSVRVASLIAIAAFVVGCQQQQQTMSEPAPSAPAPVADSAPPPPPPPPAPDRPSYDGPVDMNGNPVGNTVYFEYDSSVLSSSDATLLGYHATYLKNATDRHVTIEGHCDERGTPEYNLALGERRGQSVKDVLTGDGVDGGRLEVVSKGELEPDDAGHDESAWARNRRAELQYRAR